MKLNQLKALIAVADAGSIQEGAKLLHLTQSALSKSIKELERDVGAELLVRTARGAALTVCGQAMIRRSRSIEKELGRMREEIDSFRGAKGCRLAIGYAAPAATSPLADAVAAFVAKQPTVDVQLVEMRGAQIAEGLRNGTLDLGIMSQYGAPDTDFRYRRMLSHDTVLLSSNPHTPRQTTLSALADETWLSLDPLDDASSALSTLFAQFELPCPGKIIRCSSIPLYMQLAVRVNAVMHFMEAALPNFERRLQDGKMKVLELPHQMPKLNIYLQYPDEDLLTSSAAEFAELYERQCRRWDGKPVPSLSVAIP